MCHLKLDMICCTAWKIYRLKISICPLLRKCSERDRRARHEPVSRRDNAMLGWSSIIIYEGYIGDCFDRIPGIVSQARRHLHDTELEVIERIHRRLGNSLFLVNHFTVILVLHFVRDNGLNSRRVEISMWGDWDETMSGKQAVRGENPYNNLYRTITITSKNRCNGEGKRQNEFAEWHVAWLAEWHNYAECKIWKKAQRNKLNWKVCGRLCRAFFSANLSEQLFCWSINYCWLKPTRQSRKSQ